MVRFPLVAKLVLFGALALALAGCGGGHGSSRANWHPNRHSDAAEGPSGDETYEETPEGPESTPSPTAPGKSGIQPASHGAPSPSSSSSSAPAKGLNLSQKMTDDGSVALTFDDGPSDYTPQILALLREQHVKATFCLVGVNVKAHPDLVQQIVNDGHTLCNHTWKHDLKLGRKSPDQIRADLQATNDEIHRAVPDAQIKYFRHPGGNFTQAAVDVAKELGMASIGWDVDPGDWDLSKRKGQAMTDHIITNVRQHTRAGSIVLSHDSGGDRTCTITAYKTLLPELKTRFTLAALPV
jgi:peptidoglycan/xylan/chitin deacetylase (PgdA/CDA1 family)